MTTAEKLGLGGAIWCLFAALIYGGDHKWLSVFICLCIAAGLLTWVFGAAADRRWERQQRESADLLSRLYEEDARVGRYHWEKDERGFYVRRTDDNDDRADQ